MSEIVVQKTKSMIRAYLPVKDLIEDALNPNKMGDAEFNLLVQNIQDVGFTEPVLVRRTPDGQAFRVIGGHHRLKAAKHLDMEEVPCTIITDPDFDDDKAKFQMVRQNIIRGKMTPEGFVKLYESLQTKYSDEIASELFGFSSQAEFDKLIKKTAAGLPYDMQAAFKEAAKEIKTIDGLSKLLNRLFTEFGDTLTYNYMFLDYGGKKSVWIRMSESDLPKVSQLATLCREQKRSMDGAIRAFLQLIASGNVPTVYMNLLKAQPEIDKLYEEAAHD